MRPGSLANTMMRSAIMTASSILCETIRMPLVEMRLSSQSSSISSRSVSPVSTSSAEKASSISSTSGFITSARAMPTRWRMPPDSSRGSAAEAAQADQVQHLVGAAGALGRRHALRLQSQLHVLLGRQPRKQREGLEHHGDARRRAVHRLAPVHDGALVGIDQARHDTQQRGLARAGLAQQGHDLAFMQDEIHMLQHMPRRAVGGAEGLAHVMQFDQGIGVHEVS